VVIEVLHLENQNVELGIWIPPSDGKVSSGGTTPTESCTSELVTFKCYNQGNSHHIISLSGQLMIQVVLLFCVEVRDNKRFFYWQRTVNWSFDHHCDEIDIDRQVVY